MSRRRHTDPDSSLSPLMLQILLALGEGERHGYAIMQEIERRTGATTEIGAGTLYRSVKQLLDAGFIVEVTPRKIVHRQRRYYGITPAGRSRAALEAQRLIEMVDWAQATDLLDSGHA